MPVLLKHVPFANNREVPATEAPRSPLAAAVIASVESGSGKLSAELSHRRFRELVQERGRSCDEVLLELRRAALQRDVQSARPDPSEMFPRQRITGRRVGARPAARVGELEAENERLRRIVADQRLDLEMLRRPGR